jgi:undecaprenyl-diphosphatase
LWLAGLAAGATAYASTAFLMRYFRRREESPALDPFAYYCWAVGVLTLFYLALA